VAHLKRIFWTDRYRPRNYFLETLAGAGMLFGFLYLYGWDLSSTLLAVAAYVAGVALVFPILRHNAARRQA
jgi:hypothetical protein